MRFDYKKSKNISRVLYSNEHLSFLNSNLKIQCNAVVAKLWNSCFDIAFWRKFLEKSLWLMTESCFWTQTKSLRLIHLLDLSLKNLGYFQNKIHAPFQHQMKDLTALFIIVYTGGTEPEWMKVCSNTLRSNWKSGHMQSWTIIQNFKNNMLSNHIYYEHAVRQLQRALQTGLGTWPPFIAFFSIATGV